MKQFFTTFEELLDHLAETYPDRIAIRFSPDQPNSVLTYGNLRKEVDRRKEIFSNLSSSIRMEGADKNPDLSNAALVEPGATVLLTGKTDLNWILNLLGALTAGCMAVLSDPLWKADKVKRDWEKTRGPFYPGTLLFYTSGTTDKGKAVVLTQETLLRAAWNGQTMLPCQKEDRLLSVLPLNHVFGFVCAFLWPLTQGAEIDLGTGLRGLMTDPLKYRPSILTCVPTLLGLFLKANVLNPELRVILVGAGPCNEKLIQAVLAKGIHLRFGYGLTETSSGVAISMDDSDPYGFVPCPDTSFRITEEGELLLKTPCMMKGYYNLPEKTAEKLVDGEFHTGDLAKVDENGNIHILGRLKDVIVMPNGEKIFCPEAEDVLQKAMGDSVELALLLVDDQLTLAVREKMQEKREAAAEHFEEKREAAAEKMQERKEAAREHFEERKEAVREHLQEKKARVAEKIAEKRENREARRTSPEEAVDDWNANEGLGRKIRKVIYVKEDFPRTATGKLQRYRLQQLVEEMKAARGK